MISFKSFVNAIHDAIINASDSLMDKNVGLLDKYFEENTREIKDPETDEVTKKTILDPKTVILEYPSVDASGNEVTSEVHVPLITLVPLQMSQVEKAVVTADFEMEIIDGEIELNFPKKGNGLSFLRKPKKNSAKLEITITPQETSEGLKVLVEGYESILKRQIS
ncbi:hypothetical protein BFP97_07355 [Roseivirga sp. 4D4]|uniref:DUF2589 domain-containing protein n=1 Tax=Roseivirga sp. 4D4 TaxID=1889784 RepID=UPI000853EC5C|nr:DUF2589 domain-containing protein [Roseivirga sp. 4D4]OEK01341.1 hypothetical protein BFP97_07355 [Roseivirga sp. 4D4]